MTSTMKTALVPQFEQKYKAPSFIDIKSTSLNPLKVHHIFDDKGIQIADLLEIDNFDKDVENQFSFETIVSPKVFAANKSSSSNRVHNTASLYGGVIIKRYANVNAYADYTSRILSKEMVHRDGVMPLSQEPPVNAVDNANLRTTTLADGFHYIDKSVIYRLIVNAEGLDLTGTGGSTGMLPGNITVSDVLPLGWEFVPFSSDIDAIDPMYLIFNGNTSGNAAGAAPLDTVSGLSHQITKGTDIVSEKAEFTFTTLNQTYVILVKARPKAGTLVSYFNDTKITGSTSSDRITNTLNLSTQNATFNTSTTQNLSIKSDLLTKGDPHIMEASVLRWTVAYKPYNLSTPGTMVRDTLPVGLDLRTDSTGKLLLGEGADKYITMQEIILQADGSYTEGSPVEPVLGDNVFYDTAARALSFIIPDSAKSYRFTYITDVTGEPGDLTNQVELVGMSATSKPQIVKYTVSKADGEATLKRGGSLEITKTDRNGGKLDDAEFTLFALDGTTVIRGNVSKTDGKVTLRAIPQGNYLLRETRAPSGYDPDATTHTVKVSTEGTTVVTRIDGKTGEDASKLTVINYTPTELTSLGSLKISKTVTGEGTIPSDRFTFNLSLTTPDDLNTYIYTIFKKDALGNNKLVASDD